MAGVEYQVTKVDPTDPETKGMVYQVHKVSEEVAATLGGKVYRARIIKDPTEPTVAGKVYQIVLIDDPEDPSVKGKVYNAILTGGSEVVVIGPAVSPLALDDAIADSLTYVKAYGGTEQHNLPAGYTQLEYIESTGTQYINTGFTPNQDTSIETKAQLSASSGVRFFASYGPSSNAPYYGVGFSGSGKWVNQTNTSNQVTNVNADTNLHTIYKNKNVLYVDGAQIDDSGSGDFTSNYSIYLLAANIGGSTSFISAGKMYYAKIWDGNTLVRNFIPCKNASNVVGMYDTINGVFYQNGGTGDFVAGDAAVPTPNTPMNIVTNNGVLKVGQAVTVDPTRNYAYINATGSWSWSDDSYSVALPVEVGKKYKIDIVSTDASVVGVIFRYGFTDEDPEAFKQSEVAPSPVSVPIYDYWRGTPQELSSVTVTATHPYLVIQFSAAFAASVVSTYLTVKKQVVYADGTVETVWVHGKNLFDSTPYKTGYYIDASGNEVAATQYQEEYLIRQARVQPSTQYTISLKGTVSGYTQRIHAYDKNGNWISQITTMGPSVGETVSYTFTTPANCAYVRQGGRSQTEYQLEQGSIATEYEPYYNGGTATSEMLLKVGDYTDVQEILSGAVTRNVGVKVLDGTENIGKSSQYNGSFFVRNAVSDWGTSNNAQVFCSHFSGVTTDTDYAQNKCMILNNAFNMWWASDNTPTVAQFTQWLVDQYNAGTPVIVVYPLATATTESVTGQTLQVQDGDNTLEITQASLDGLQLEAEYEKEA